MQVFSLSIWLFFSFDSSTFKERQHFVWMKSSPSMRFLLWLMLLVSYLRNLCLIQDHKFLFYGCGLFSFFPRSSRVWSFIITPIIYCEFICVYDTRYWSRFIFCFKDQSPNHLWKVKLFSIESPLCLCQKSIDHVCVCLFLEGLLLFLLIFGLILLPIPQGPTHSYSSITSIQITYLCFLHV